ncbi:hypothetical protein [Methanopyrus kandleri]
MEVLHNSKHSGTPYENSRFKLEVRYVVSERAERILEEYGLDRNSVRKAFERSLKFLSLLGGVGARSRRCAGSLMWEEAVPEDPDGWEASKISSTSWTTDSGTSRGSPRSGTAISWSASGRR